MIFLNGQFEGDIIFCHLNNTEQKLSGALSSYVILKAVAPALSLCVLPSYHRAPATYQINDDFRNAFDVASLGMILTAGIEQLTETNISIMNNCALIPILWRISAELIAFWALISVLFSSTAKRIPPPPPPPPNPPPPPPPLRPTRHPHTPHTHTKTIYIWLAKFLLSCHVFSEHCYKTVISSSERRECNV